MSGSGERQTGIVGDGYYHGGNPCRPSGKPAAPAEQATTLPREEAPDESWTNRRLREYAKEHDIGLGDVHKKADMLTLIRGA